MRTGNDDETIDSPGSSVFGLGRCLVVDAYSYFNAGDAAITLCSKELLQDLGATSVALSTRYSDTEYAYHDIHLFPELIPFPVRGSMSEQRRALRIASGIARALVVLGLDPFSRAFAQKICRLLLPSARVAEHFDTIVIAGGGYMYTSRRSPNLSLIHSMLTIRLGQVLCSTSLMMPQSVGPLHRRFDAAVVSWGLRRLQPVCREQVSLRASTAAPRLRNPIEIPDVVFYFPLHHTSHDQATRKVIRIVVMDWRWSLSSKPEQYKAYLDGMVIVGRHFVESGFEVIYGGHSLLPDHGQDDVALAKSLSERVDGSRVDPCVDVEHLYNEYAHAACVIGTRLHSAIMAWSIGTPAVALGYQEKTRGVLEVAGLGRFALPVDELDTATLIAAAESAMNLDRSGLGIHARSLRTRIRVAYEELL
jgi:colanic acid/amylovoran biosynthesis protein